MLRLVHPTPPADTDDDTPIDIRPPTDYEARIRAEQERENTTRAAVAALRPAWAEALIVAECEHDACDSQSDYFNTKTSRIVALAWSRHTRDLFPELRKAAARFEETRHLGPGCSLVTANVILLDDVVSGGSGYWKGSASHWHRELYGDSSRYRDAAGPFTTRAQAEAFILTAAEPEPIRFNGNTPEEKIVRFGWQINDASVEHREKYSMGHGYYLKAAGRYDSGWMIRKVSPGNVAGRMELDLLR